ncbi:hypothetical protein DB32_008630 [Sandaracinus amylolyticus]|uniref:Uncharacterized protein n=1 Tax=Sandaracinus amylolyticus TaxID=927083 RepID=A0A0F6WAC2_9BACT|nr:hypothetical protein DB32_008630 [Sandaracinus amylolyticus]
MSSRVIDPAEMSHGSWNAERAVLLTRCSAGADRKRIPDPSAWFGTC